MFLAGILRQILKKDWELRWIDGAFLEFEYSPVDESFQENTWEEQYKWGYGIDDSSFLDSLLGGNIQVDDGKAEEFVTVLHAILGD